MASHHGLQICSCTHKYMERCGCIHRVCFVNILIMIANMRLHTQIHGKMRLQLQHLTCAYSDLCLMACKDAVAHTDTWLVSISVPLNQCHTAPVSRMHAVPALFGMYVLLLCTCESTYNPHTAGTACMRETGAVSYCLLRRPEMACSKNQISGVYPQALKHKP